MSNRYISYRRNGQIRISPVRVIATDGEQLGVIPTEEALKLAREKDVDLIEVAPNVRPPVCKLMEWSKFKYELSKKQRGQQKKREKTKEMQFKTLIDDHDLKHKLKKVYEFLGQSHKVKLRVRTPRRVSIRQSEELMDRILKKINKKAEVEMIQNPRREGFFVTAMIKSDGKSKNKQNSEEKIPGNSKGKGSS